MPNNAIRDIRESKNLSQDAVAAEAEMTYSVFVRIEAGTGKTTDAEVQHVLRTLRGMKKQDRKIGGRPFGDPTRQAAVTAAREMGTSVAAVLAGVPEDTLQTPKPKRTRKPKEVVEDLL